MNKTIETAPERLYVAFSEAGPRFPSIRHWSHRPDRAERFDEDNLATHVEYVRADLVPPLVFCACGDGYPTCSEEGRDIAAGRGCPNCQAEGDAVSLAREIDRADTAARPPEGGE